ncbi:hypothetical protein BKA69DRAFT_1139980 [Paraphysoderma sedebokerense]|nr:hypothetical protein BKA69DRAFT_1139980 [Paraphysoderma sedebokerense]
MSRNMWWQLATILAQKIYTTLRVNRNYLLQPNGELKAAMKSKLDDIMKMTDTEITILGEFPSHLQPPPGITQEMTAIEISGVRENVELARVKFLVLLDELSGLFCDALEIDLKLHNMIAGRKHQDLHRIMKITYTNIYLPSPFCIQAHHLKSLQPQVAWEHQIPPGYGQIFITGDHSNVQQAKDMLVASIMRPIRTFNVTVMPRKIDWIATHKKESLLKIMRDNGTFIALPPLGSSSNIITVYGDNMVYIQRSIRMIARLACDFYVACFRIVPPLNQNRPMNSAGHDLSKLPPLNQIAAFIKQITSTSLAEIVYNNSFFEVYGFDRSVADAYERISQMDFVKNSPRETKFQLELGQEHREFISGKKNGKINKIIKSTGVKINFENFNEYNMVIDILSPYFDKALEGLFLLKDELPAEISFHVPEAFHKRIIGVGGKNIQRIMKKFGVFVKFSNAEEHEALGGYFENEDNVIARTPAKNAFNLLNLKQTVMELVNPKDHEVLHYLTSIPLRYHRVMEPQIPSIENAAGVKIQISDREKGSDEVLVIGYESNIKLALQLLSDCTAEDYEFRVPASTNLMITIGSMKFKESVVDRIAREFDITLVAPVPNTKEEMDSMTMDKGEYKFIFRCLKRTVKYLEEAKKMLNDYLSANGVSLYQKPNTLMRIDSVPLGEVEKPFDSFRHFNSKLFSAATIGMFSFCFYLDFPSFSLLY